MSLKATWFRDKLKKKAKQGFQGFPVASIAYYGPDDKHARRDRFTGETTQGALKRKAGDD